MSAHTAAMPPLHRTRHIVLLGYDGLTALDLSGPAEVFATAAAWLAERHPAAPPAYTITVASLDGPRFVAENGLALCADTTIDAIDHGDTVIVPGGRGLRETERLTRAAGWLRERHPAFRRVTSVCTGAYALAEAGLLDGAAATTHWRHADAFAARYPAVAVVLDALYLRHDRVYTSAGVTAGIDLCLALVEQDHGPECALAVARELVVHVKRAGGQRQYVDRLAARGSDDARIAALCAWMLDHLDGDLGLAVLAQHCHCSERQLSRRFMRAFGLTPAAYVERLRVEEAGQRLIASTSGIERIAHAVGFRSVDVFRRAFERHYGVSPRDYRERFRTLPSEDPSA